MLHAPRLDLAAPRPPAGLLGGRRGRYRAVKLTGVAITLGEITDENREAVIALRVGDGGPSGFYQRLGFGPTGDLDGTGEVIMRLVLP
jgi:hypothetical protein